MIVPITLGHITKIIVFWILKENLIRSQSSYIHPNMGSFVLWDWIMGFSILGFTGLRIINSSTILEPNTIGPTFGGFALSCVFNVWFGSLIWII